jgi:hypothetical protein
MQFCKALAYMDFKPQKLQELTAPPTAPACSIEPELRTVPPAMPGPFSAHLISFGTGSLIFLFCLVV